MYCYTEHINQTTMSVNTEAQVTKKWFIWRPIVVSNPIYFTRSYSSFRHNCTLAVKSFDYGLSVPTFLSTSSEMLQRMSVLSQLAEPVATAFPLGAALFWFEMGAWEIPPTTTTITPSSPGIWEPCEGQKKGRFPTVSYQGEHWG